MEEMSLSLEAGVGRDQSSQGLSPASPAPGLSSAEEKSRKASPFTLFLSRYQRGNGPGLALGNKEDEVCLFLSFQTPNTSSAI